MTKEDFVRDGNRFKSLLMKVGDISDSEAEESNKLWKRWGNSPAFQSIKSNSYDARVKNPGWGAPNCSCHIMPPCQNCVDYTNEKVESGLL